MFWVQPRESFTASLQMLALHLRRQSSNILGRETDLTTVVMHLFILQKFQILDLQKLKGCFFHILCHITFMLCITIYICIFDSLENSYFLMELLKVSMLYCLSDHMNFVILCFRLFNLPRLVFFLVLFYLTSLKLKISII